MTKGAPNQDKKKQILSAATDLITRNGIQAISFEGIASHAGLSRQLVRYYYSDMDALIVDLCDYLGNVYREMLVAGIVNVREVERLNFFLDFFFGLLDDYPMPDNLEAYDSLVAYAVGSPQLRERMCDQYKTLGQVIVHELAIAHPELDGRSCEELSYVFVSMMHAHWSFVATLKHTDGHGRLARRAIERLVQSYIESPDPVPELNRPWARTD